MRKKRIDWPRIFSLVLALIPLCMLLLIIINLAVGSRLAISTLGLKGLFSTKISGLFSTNQGLYGIIPAIWGTILVVIVSMCIAVPISLAVAVFSSEFTLGFLGKGIRTILGVFSGIPSIIYAMMAAVFAQLFIVPKFCGTGIPGNQMPPPGMYWWRPGVLPFSNSTLLGGIMLSMLLIPFLAPLLDDAIKDVPGSLKEASLSLGASRWHTLKTVTLPYALSGITSACGLGTLQAMGDVVIVGMVISFESPLPNPLFDVLKSTATLTSTGAGFSGGFTQSAANPLRNSAANFTGLVLLVMTFIILALIPFMQNKFKKRYSQ